MTQRCASCRITLYPPCDPVFAKSVFAEDGHNCFQAKAWVTSARTHAREVDCGGMSIRRLSKGVTHLGWSQLVDEAMPEARKRKEQVPMHRVLAGINSGQLVRVSYCTFLPGKWREAEMLARQALGTLTAV